MEKCNVYRQPILANIALYYYCLCYDKKNQELTTGENNPFNKLFFKTKIELVFGIEGGVLASSHEIKIAGLKISIYVIFALILNLIEGVGAFYLVSKLGLFDDLPVSIRIVISAFPVVITWMFAFLQADWFHRPEYARQIFHKYQKKKEAMESESESIDDIYKTLVRLEAGINAMLDRNSEYYTVELAEIDAEKRHYEEEITKFKVRGKVRLNNIENKYEQRKIEIEAEYPDFQPNEEELTQAQLEVQVKDYEQRKQQDLAEKLRKIENDKQQKITQINSEIQEELEKLEIKKNLAQQKFNQKKAEWETEEREIHQRRSQFHVVEN